MNVSKIFITSILFINAYLLLTDGTQRHNFHIKIQKILQITNLQCDCITFQFLQGIRFAIIAFLITAGISIFESSLLHRIFVIFTILLHLIIFNNPYLSCSCHFGFSQIRSMFLNLLVLFALVEQNTSNNTNSISQCCDHNKSNNLKSSEKPQIKAQGKSLPKSQTKQLPKTQPKQNLQKKQSKQSKNKHK